MLILIILFGLFLPRLVLFLCWVTGVFAGAFSTCVWPVLGFVFLPYTTLAWALAEVHGGGVHGFWLVMVIIGVLLDLGAGERTVTAGRRR